MRAIHPVLESDRLRSENVQFAEPVELDTVMPENDNYDPYLNGDIIKFPQNRISNDNSIDIVNLDYDPITEIGDQVDN